MTGNIQVVTTVLGGLALFIYGMGLMSDARMSHVISRTLPSELRRKGFEGAPSARVVAVGMTLSLPCVPRISELVTGAGCNVVYIQPERLNAVKQDLDLLAYSARWLGWGGFGVALGTTRGLDGLFLGAGPDLLKDIPEGIVVQDSADAAVDVGPHAVDGTVGRALASALGLFKARHDGK